LSISLLSHFWSTFISSYVLCIILIITYPYGAVKLGEFSLEFSYSSFNLYASSIEFMYLQTYSCTNKCNASLYQFIFCIVCEILKFWSIFDQSYTIQKRIIETNYPRRSTRESYEYKTLILSDLLRISFVLKLLVTFTIINKTYVEKTWHYRVRLHQLIIELLGYLSNYLDKCYRRQSIIIGIIAGNYLLCKMFWLVFLFWNEMV